MKLIENLKNNPLEYIFYLFVFLLPWQTRWIIRDFNIDGIIFEYGRISLYGFDIVLVVLLLLLFIKLTRRGNQVSSIKYQVSSIILLILVLFSLLSTLWASDKLVSLYWGIRMIFGFGLFWLVQQIDFSRIRLAITVVIAGAIQGLLGIWQFVGQSVWQAKWLGVAGQEARDLGTSVVEFGIERWLRAYGSLPHPNIYGAFLVLSFMGVIYLILKIEHKYHKLFLIFSASFIWLGILFSYSRASWIGLGLVFIGGIWMVWKVKDKWIRKFGKWFWIYGFILLTVFTVLTLPIVKTRLHIGYTERLEIVSDMERIAGFRAVKEMVKDNWLLGTGMGNYVFELQQKYPDEKIWYIHPVHNVPLVILGELGVVGFILVFTLISYLVVQLLKKRRWGYFGLLLVIFCLMMFDHFWWTLGSGMYVLWLVMGIVVKKALAR